jgi:hypothetical protein
VGYGLAFWDCRTGDAIDFVPLQRAWTVMFETAGSLLTEGVGGPYGWPIQPDGNRPLPCGNWKEAVAALEKLMKLRNGGDSFDWFFLAMARWQLGEKEKARTWFDKAVQWMDKNQPRNEELGRFRKEAAQLLGMKAK